MAEEKKIGGASEEFIAEKASTNPYQYGRKHIKYLQRMKKEGKKLVQHCPAGRDHFFTMAANFADVDICRLVSHGSEAYRKHNVGLSEYYKQSAETIAMHRSVAPRIHINYMMETGMWINKENAVANGADLIKAGADSFLCMGISNETVRFMSDNYVPVFSHVGSISGWQTNSVGGYKHEGKTAEEALAIFKWAYEYQENGMGCMTIEMTPYEVSEAIAKKLTVPVIAIAGSAPCDGSEMVDMDLFGMNPTPASHTLVLGNYMEWATGIYGEWVRQVRTGEYPAEKHGWRMDPAELEKFNKAMEQF